ncbi:MAG: nucleotidyltransferase [Syntrophales bacterium]|nr:nucleotidyltransferase [Syntrophales bacterium]MDD5640131.1 nucleotidyltransferase [Syntrophales bacterium]
MPEPTDLAPLLLVLRDLMAWLKAGKVPGVVIGGLAASLMGRPRLTRDVDMLVLVDQGQWPEFIAAGAKHGFIPRRDDALAFAKETQVLLVRHQESGIDVDIVFGALPFEKEAIARATWMELGNVQAPLPLPEDLIIMKAVAHRPQDLADIEGILAVHPKLNLRRVRRWVSEFSSALEMPEVLNDLEALLSQRKKKT